MKPSIVLAFASVALALSIPMNHDKLPGSSRSLQNPLFETPSDAEPKPTPELPQKPHGSIINHGTIIYANKSHVASPNSSYIHTLNIEQSPYHLLERYSDELFAIGLLLLVPITLGLVEVAERLSRSMTVEEFPERGREKYRMGSLRERKQWFLKRKEREATIGQSRSWWKTSRC